MHSINSKFINSINIDMYNMQKVKKIILKQL